MRVARSSCLKSLVFTFATSAAFCALSIFGAQKAQAQVNLGAEAGAAFRSSGLQVGQAVGAHAEYKVIPLISVGAYYLYQGLPLKDASPNASVVTFRTFGGRARFTLPLPGSNFRPYGFVGLGWTGVEYPSTASIGNINATTVSSANVVKRSGSYLEAPIGVGCGYQISVVQLSLDLAFRPGFSFSGDAYEGATAFDKPQLGLSSMFGVSLDI